MDGPPTAPLATRAVRSSGARRTVPRWGERSLILVAALAVAFFGLPVVILVVRSVANGALVSAFSSPTVIEAFKLSMVTTALSLVITVVLGLPLAIVLARYRFRGSTLVEAIVDLPIVLPPSVAGLALLLALGRQGALGGALSAFGIEIPFTTAAVVIAQTFVSAPFFILSARTGIAGVDRDLEDAARVDGATESHLFRSITIPLASTALTAGLVMSWARSLGEFGATIMFAGNVEGQTQTLPLVVYSEFQSGDLDTTIAASAILVLAAFGVLVAVRALHWGRVFELRGIT
jgi:molybdate transport system permease protein